MKKSLLFLFIFSCLALPLIAYRLPLVIAQEEEEPEDLADFESDQDIEDALENDDITEGLRDQLQDFYDNPVDVNSADETELMSLPGLKADDAQRIVQERLRNGHYEKAEDLISREALAPDLFEKIKLFVSAEKPGVFKTRGELRHETVARPEQSFKTTTDAEGKAFSPTTEKSRLKVTNIANRFRIGGSFLGDRFNIPDNIPNSAGLTVKEIRQHRWIKRYAGYDSKSAKYETGWLKSDLLQQIYIGNYRLGFFDGTSKERSLGFIPDDRTVKTNKITLTSGEIKAPPLTGFGAKAGTKKLNYSTFYSKDEYPAQVPVQKENAVTGALSVSSATVEDALEMETFGGYLGYSPSISNHSAVFWVRNKSDLNLLGKNTPALRTTLWGLHHKNAFKFINYRSVFARVDEPVSKIGNSNERNFYFGRINITPGNGSDLIFSYKRIESGFMNPVGDLFSGNYIWRFNTILVQKIRKFTTVRFDFSQEERFADRLPAKKVGVQVRWRPPQKTSLQLSQYYTDKNIREARGPDKTVTATASNELRTEARVIHKPSKKIENRFDFELKSSKRQFTDKFLVGQTVGYRLVYQWAQNIQFRGEFRYADTDVNKSNSETQTFRLELRTRPLKELDFQLRWENKFRTKNQTIIIDNVEQEIDNPGTQNTITLRVVYKW